MAAAGAAGVKPGAAGGGAAGGQMELRRRLNASTVASASPQPTNGLQIQEHCPLIQFRTRTASDDLCFEASFSPQQKNLC